LFVNSPELIADFHALHRLSIPRHPPCALSNLTIGILNSAAPFSARRRITLATGRIGRSDPWFAIALVRLRLTLEKSVAEATNFPRTSIDHRTFVVYASGPFKGRQRINVRCHYYHFNHVVKDQTACRASAFAVVSGRRDKHLRVRLTRRQVVF
jgi:hypothetical protein